MRSDKEIIKELETLVHSLEMYNTDLLEANWELSRKIIKAEEVIAKNEALVNTLVDCYLPSIGENKDGSL